MGNMGDWAFMGAMVNHITDENHGMPNSRNTIYEIHQAHLL
jgi:hypothetical protein